MTKPIFNQITIIGLGLIGSSIARAAHSAKIAEKIVGFDENELSSAFARKEHFIDIAAENLESAVAGSDFVIIATPPATLADIAEAISPRLKEGAIITDVASVKRPAVEAIAPHIPQHATFIPAHPIAGSEKTGVGAGRADLFNKKRVIITPKQPPAREIFEKIKIFWESFGAKVEAMPPEIHDTIYGYMSHLPQLIAFCLEQPLGKFYTQTEDNPVFKTFLRISRSDSHLWAEIFSANKDNILAGLDRYIDVVTHVHKELKNAPAEAIKETAQIDEKLAYTVLFPRIIASCLVTTVMEAENKAGIPLAQYAGTGFADFTAPTFIAPDADIEKISAQYKTVEKIINAFLIRLKLFRNTLAN